MSVYYISNSGCDSFDGLSEATAFKTINQLNKVIKGGDTALFKCGDTFYGNIKAPAGINPENPTKFTSYGEGKKPIITQYKIMNEKNYKPSKNTVIAFAIALELTLEETNHLLATVGFALSKSNKFDIIIEYFLINGEYNIFTINETLFKFDQVCLGV